MKHYLDTHDTLNKDVPAYYLTPEPMAKSSSPEPRSKKKSRLKKIVKGAALVAAAYGAKKLYDATRAARANEAK